jgi:hypothetical protein
MINFNNKENKLIEKEYPLLYRYIREFILRHKKELPKILKVRLFDYEAGRENSTGLSYRESRVTGAKYNYGLDINLRQILRLYKDNNGLNDSGRIYPGQIKGIRKYILFVIYHELGHYNIRHSQDYAGRGDIQEEINCDKWAFDKLLQGQLEFIFNGRESD